MESRMNIEKVKELTAYEVVKEKRIEEIDSYAVLLKHKKTGARVLLLDNNDNNKVFNIGFRTPVDDETGVPHIIEHTVLCGSKKYPLKDPFMELVKGSMNTFINAMTYPDKTVYPVASTNNQDFKNLMSVYMDAVFNPNIYDEENIFKQEGWHYELESPEDELKINGIVYSEMKGVHSSADGVLERISFRSLFPDTTYANESGGFPEAIPDLTYEDYLDFHRRYYHPSNSYIYLYGDMDFAERLQWIEDEYLSHYDYLAIDSSVDLQKTFDKPISIDYPYSITDDQDEDSNYIYSLNYVVGKSDDVKLQLAAKLVQYAIMDIPGAPLKQALLDAGLGTISASYEQDICQPVFSIVAKNCSGKDKQKFQEVVKTTLQKIVEEGIDKEVLKAGFFGMEFEDKEQDFGVYPKGLMFSLRLLSSWLYDDDKAWTLLETNEALEELKALIDTDYFEKIIEEYLLNNNHSSLVTMVPTKGLTAQKEKELKDKLAAKKASLSDEEIETIIKQTKDLKAYQEEAPTKEALESIPLLEIKDIEKNHSPIISKESEESGVKFLHTDIFTNKIGYLNVEFLHTDIPKKYLNTIGLVKYFLGMLSTEDHTYKELGTIIDLNLGGFAFAVTSYSNRKEDKDYIVGELRLKTFYDNIYKGFELAKEVLLKTKYDDYKRIKVILEETKDALYSQILERGDVISSGRAASYYSKQAYIADMGAGIGLYDFLKDILDNYDQKKEQFATLLKDTVEYIFTKGNILVSYGGDKTSFENVKKMSFDLIDVLGEEKANDDPWEFVPDQKNEAFVTPGQVQFVSRVGEFMEQTQKYNGALFVLAGIMRKEYLWNNVRVLGGAYGCFTNITKNGNISLSSYRDPNLKTTSDTFLGSADYISSFKADEREMRKFIIGAISGIDRPLSNSDKCSRELSLYLSGETDDEIQQRRDEVLSASEEAIRALAVHYDKAMSEGNICVIGSKSQIEANKDLFKEIRVLV